MKIRRVPLSEVMRIAYDLGLRPRGASGDGETFSLTPLGERWRQNSRHRPPHACIHGFEALTEAILAEYPGAMIETVVTTYRGLDDFNARQEDVWEEVLDRYGEPDCTCNREGE